MPDSNGEDGCFSFQDDIVPIKNTLADQSAYYKYRLCAPPLNRFKVDILIPFLTFDCHLVLRTSKNVFVDSMLIVSTSGALHIHNSRWVHFCIMSLDISKGATSTSGILPSYERSTSGVLRANLKVHAPPPIVLLHILKSITLSEKRYRGKGLARGARCVALAVYP